MILELHKNLIDFSGKFLRKAPDIMLKPTEDVSVVTLTSDTGEILFQTRISDSLDQKDFVHHGKLVKILRHIVTLYGETK